MLNLEVKEKKSKKIFKMLFLFKPEHKIGKMLMFRFLFQFIDLPSRTGGPGLLGIAIPVVVAVAILLILIGE